MLILCGFGGGIVSDIWITYIDGGFGGDHFYDDYVGFVDYRDNCGIFFSIFWVWRWCGV